MSKNRVQKISLLPANSMQQPSLGRGQNISEVATKKIRVASTGSGKTVKRASSDNRPFDRKNRINLETKSSIIRKPIASKTDNRIKKNLDTNQKNKTANKALEKPRPLSARKETNTPKKEGPKKQEAVKRPSNKVEKVQTTSKEKSSTDSEFKRKFDSILNKNANESKAPTLSSSQKPKNIIEKVPKSSIFNTKANEKATLQIETWGPAQAPKPLFNLSKALMRSNVVEKKSVPEKILKIFPHPENVMKRLSKQMIHERSHDKPNAPKIWRY